MTTPVHILVVEDHPLFRDALARALVRAEPGREQSIRCSTADGQAQALETLGWNPDVALVLADQRLNEGNGLDLLAEVGRRWPTMARVLMSGGDDVALAQQARRLGLMGYIPKSLEPDELVAAVDCVLGADTWFPAEASSPAEPGPLTERQAAVLACVAAGQSNKQVARTLGISERTIKYHLEAAFLRLQVANRAEAVVTALARGLIRVPA